MAFSGEANNSWFFFQSKEIRIPVSLLNLFYDELVQIPVIPEDIFFTSEFTEVAKLEESNDNSAELVSKTFHQVVFLFENVETFAFIHTSGLLVYIPGQHSFGGSAAPLHMLSIPGQVFIFSYPLEKSVALGCHCLTYIMSFAGEFRKLLAAFVSGSTSKSSGIVRKITPTSAEPKDTQVANRSQQKLQVSL